MTVTAEIMASLLYGVLAVVGGVIGYIQASSKPSLISGIISGILLIAGAALQWQGQAWGWWLDLLVTLALVVVFIKRLVDTRKLMPAGLMTVAGVATLVILLV